MDCLVQASHLALSPLRPHGLPGAMASSLAPGASMQETPVFACDMHCILQLSSGARHTCSEGGCPPRKGGSAHGGRSKTPYTTPFAWLDDQPPERSAARRRATCQQKPCWANGATPPAQQATEVSARRHRGLRTRCRERDFVTTTVHLRSVDASGRQNLPAYEITALEGVK